MDQSGREPDSNKLHEAISLLSSITTLGSSNQSLTQSSTASLVAPSPSPAGPSSSVGELAIQARRQYMAPVHISS